jgi:hypothetical protein
VRLERLNEAALFLGLKIPLDGGGACEDVRFSGTYSRSRLLQIENRAKGFYLGTK